MTQSNFYSLSQAAMLLNRSTHDLIKEASEDVIELCVRLEENARHFAADEVYIDSGELVEGTDEQHRYYTQGHAVLRQKDIVQLLNEGEVTTWRFKTVNTRAYEHLELANEPVRVTPDNIFVFRTSIDALRDKERMATLKRLLVGTELPVEIFSALEFHRQVWSHYDKEQDSTPTWKDVKAFADRECLSKSMPQRQAERIHRLSKPSHITQGRPSDVKPTTEAKRDAERLPFEGLPEALQMTLNAYHDCILQRDRSLPVPRVNAIEKFLATKYCGSPISAQRMNDIARAITSKPHQ